jgi:hypothetical protein
VVGVLADDADPMVSVMKLEKAPTESYADIGGLDTQIQEIKVLSSFTFLYYSMIQSANANAFFCFLVCIVLLLLSIRNQLSFL